MRGAWLGIICVICGGCAAASPPEPLWVGHLVARTGPDASRGESAVAGLDVAVAGGKFQLRDRPVGVRHVDAAGGKARAEATRLIAANGVVALIVGPGVEAGEVIAAAQSAKVPVFVAAESAEATRDESVVYCGTDPAARGRQLGEAVAKNPGEVLAVVDAKDATLTAVGNGFREGLGKGRTVATVEVDEGRAPEATKAATVFVGFNSRKYPKAFAGLVAAHPKATFVAAEDGKPEGYGDAVVLATHLPPATAEAAKAFLAALDKKYPDARPGPARTAAESFDVLRLVLPSSELAVPEEVEALGATYAVKERRLVRTSVVIRRQGAKSEEVKPGP